MLKGFIAGIGAAVFLIAVVLIYRGYYAQCPCGFKYDYLTGGCVVDINAGPCGNTGGSSGSRGGGSSGSGSGSSGEVIAGQTPPSCEISVGNCVIHPDWKGVDFTLFYTGGTVSKTPVSLPVQLSIQQRDKAGKACVQIKGEIDVPENKPTTIPFDPGTLAGSFPVATTSASGAPTKGLVSSFHDSCRGTKTDMIVVPAQSTACGCKTSFVRD